ncbi:hypothetical protein ACWDU3_06945 [Streptomyces olivaceus]
MITTRVRRWATASVFTLTAVLGPLAPGSALAAAPGASVSLQLPEPTPADTARAELAGLAVSAPQPMTGYSRAKFPHWIQQGDRCDTRVICTAGSRGSRNANGSTAIQLKSTV